MTTFFEHQRTSFKKSYLSNLISLASADGTLDDDEKALIVKIGQKRGLKEWQINDLLADTSRKDAFIPESINNRMDMLYDFMQIVYVDKKVSEHEVEFVSNVVASFKLRPDIVDQLIVMFSDGTPESSEWKEYVEYICDDIMRREKQD